MDTERICEVLSKKPDKIIFSGLVDNSYKYKKIVIKKIIIKGREVYQAERFTEKQTFHENMDAVTLESVVFSEFPGNYKQLNIFCEDVQYDFKYSKKGKLLFNEHKIKLSKNLKHNNDLDDFKMITHREKIHTTEKRIIFYLRER